MTKDPIATLLPCPFCGIKLVERAAYWAHPNITTDCPAQHIVLDPRESVEIAAWNTRLETDKARLEEVREALEAIADQSVFNQLRFAGEDDTDYFLRCSRAVADHARQALAAMGDG